MGTSCYGHVQGCTPTCPCMLWTRTALNTRQNEHTCVLALFSLSLSLLLWCQTLKGKNFYYLKGPPVQCLFFSPLLFLMCVGKVPVSFTPSLYVPQVRKQTRRGVQQPKEALRCQAAPLLLCKCPWSAGVSCRFEGEKRERAHLCPGFGCWWRRWGLNGDVW